MRAWYLPTWVNERDAGDVADRPDVLGGPQPLVDLDPARGISSPSGLEPVDVRPAAGRDAAAGRTAARVPSASSRLLAGRPARPARRAGCRRRPRAAPPRRAAAASASTRGSSRSSPWTSVTCEPTRWKNCASSQPTGPPPSTSSALGDLERLGRLDVRPVVDLIEPRRSAARPADEPVAITSRSYAQLLPPTWTTPGSRDDRVAAHELGIAASRATRPGTSRRVRRRGRATRRSPAGSISPTSSAPWEWRAAAASSGARSIVFVGMQAQ